MATFALLALLIGIVPAAATPIDTASTTEVHVLTIPAPDATVGGQVIPTPYSQPTYFDGGILLRDGLVNNQYLIWPGIGYPQPIGGDFPSGWDTVGVNRVNQSGTMVGSYRDGSDYRGFVWSEDQGFSAVAPPSSVTEGVIVNVLGVSEDDWITGTVWSVAGTCWPTENFCGFVGEPNGSGYDYTVFSERFSPTDIELVDGEHVVVGSQQFVGSQYEIWTGSGGLTALDNGGNEGDMARPIDINQSGQIIGRILPFSEPPPPPPETPPPPPPPHAAYWASPTSPAEVLAPLDGHDTLSLFSISEGGTVVGQSLDSGSPGASAVYWNPGDGEVTDLGHLTDQSSLSVAFSANDSGQIVGTSDLRAVIWDLTGTYDINYPPEIFTSPDGVSVEEGEILTFFPEYADPDGDELEVVWTGLPAGVEVDPDTAELTWATQAGDAGTYEATLTVREVGEPANTASAVVPLNVLPAPPSGLTISVLEPTSPVEAVVDEPVFVRFEIRNTEINDPVDTLTTIQAPEGTAFIGIPSNCVRILALSQVRCTLNSLIGAHQTDFNVTFPSDGHKELLFELEGTDPIIDGGTATVIVDVEYPPQLLDPIGLQEVSPLDTLEFTVTSSVELPLYSLRWLNPPGGEPTSDLPPGMSLSAVGGEFSWTPEIRQAGYYDMEFTVTGHPSASDELPTASEVVRINVVGAEVFAAFNWADLDGNGEPEFLPIADEFPEEVKWDFPSFVDEPEVSGLVIYVDENDDGIRNPGEPTSRGTGRGFSFPNMPVGHEIVIRQEVPQDSHRRTPRQEGSESRRRHAIRIVSMGSAINRSVTFPRSGGRYGTTPTATQPSISVSRVWHPRRSSSTSMPTANSPPESQPP